MHPTAWDDFLDAFQALKDENEMLKTLVHTYEQGMENLKENIQDGIKSVGDSEPRNENQPG